MHNSTNYNLLCDKSTSDMGSSSSPNSLELCALHIIEARVDLRKASDCYWLQYSASEDRRRYGESRQVCELFHQDESTVQANIKGILQ